MDEFIKNELYSMVVGDLVGSGASRVVYSHKLDKDLVVKIERGAKSFSNIIEWEVWQAAKGTSFEKWFCPCVDISACGSVLFMKKAKHIDEDELPKEVPQFLSDLCSRNWGKINGRPVCIDYGNTVSLLGADLKTAQWEET